MDYIDMLKTEKYFELYFLLFLIFLFLWIIKDYIITLLFAAIFVFLVRKFYERLVKKNINEELAALLIICLVFIIILIPSFLLGIALINQSNHLITQGSVMLNNFNLSSCDYSFCPTIKHNIDLFKGYANSFSSKIGQFFFNSFGSIFNSLTNLFLQLFVFVFAFFYMLKDGKKFISYIKKIIPMKSDFKNALFKKFEDVSYAVFFGTLLVAIFQGILLGLGFYVLGVPSAVFWGFITVIFALIPFLGTHLILIPGVIYFFLVHEYFKGIFLLVYGMIAVGFSDYILRPFLIKKRIDVNAFLILLSIMGGINIFGFAGIFIGPILISLLISVLDLYKLDFK